MRTGRVGTLGVLLAEALTFAFDDPRRYRSRSAGHPVHQPLADKRRIAARLLLQALDGAVAPASRVELLTRLVVRG
jgi:DNA-binding LacI/PurR family transcriptional regulator